MDPYNSVTEHVNRCILREQIKKHHEEQSVFAHLNHIYRDGNEYTVANHKQNELFKDIETIIENFWKTGSGFSYKGDETMPISLSKNKASSYGLSMLTIIK